MFDSGREAPTACILKSALAFSHQEYAEILREFEFFIKPFSRLFVWLDG